MTGAVFRLQAVLDLVDRVAAPARAVQAHLDAVQAAAARAQAALDRIGQGATLTALGASLAVPLALATRQAIAFEDAFADIKKVVDFPTPEGLRAFQRDLLALTRTIPLSARELTELSAAAAQAGIPLQELIGFTQDAARVAVAFDIAARDAGEALAKLRIQFGLSQPQVVGLTDAINALSNAFPATAREILEVTRRVGSTARIAGLTGEQVAALATTLIATGTAPEVAATGLNALILRLSTATQQSDEFQKALASLGFSAEGFQALMRRDAAGAITEFLSRLQRAPDQLGVLSAMFGMEYSDDIAKLAGSLGTLRQALGLVADPARYAGSAQQEFQNRVATTQAQLTLLRNALERVGIVLGSTLLPPVNRVVGAITAFLNRAADLLERFPALRTAVVALTVGLGGLLVVGGSLLALLGAIGFLSAQARLGLLALRGAMAATGRNARLLSLGLALLRAQLAGLGGPVGLARAALAGLGRSALLAGRGLLLMGRFLLLSPLGLAISLLTGLGAAILGAWRYSERFRESVRGTLAALRGAFAPVVAEFRGLGEALAGLFRPLQATLQATLGGVQVGLDRILYALGYGLGFLFGFLQGLLERLTPIVGEGLAGVIRLIRGLVGVVVGLLTGDWSRAVEGARLAWEGLKAVLSVPIRVGGLLLDLVHRGLSALWGAVTARFPAVRAIVEAPLRVGALLWDRVQEGFGTLLGAARAFWTALSTAFRAGIAALQALLQGDLGKALEFGRMAMTALKGALSIPLRLAGVAWDALKGALESALGWVRSLVERMAQAGRDLVSGLVRGIGEMAMAPVRAIQGIGARIWQGLKAKLGIRSPSRVMAQLGAMTALGLAVGIQDMAPAVARSAEQLAQLALPQVEGVLELPTPQVPVPELPRLRLPTPEVPQPRIPTPEVPTPQAPLPEPPRLRFPVPEVPQPQIPAPEVPAPRVPPVQLALPQVEGVLAIPPIPSLEAPALEAPPAPGRRTGQGAQATQNIRIHIERLELPSVREPEEFIEALKRLVLAYAQ